MEATYESIGGTNRQEGDYLLPDFAASEILKIRIWDEQHRRYLRAHPNALYAICPMKTVSK